MRMVVVLVVASTCLTVYAGLPECKNIGLPALSDGFIDLGGGLIGSVDGVEYGVDHVCKGQRHELWLERLVARDSKGRPTWMTLTKMVLPGVKPDERLVFGHWSTCQSDSGPDPAIIAIVRATDGPQYTTIIRAWRASGQAKAFQEISTAGTVCVNDDAGM